MRFYWVQDRVRQKQYVMYWEPGRNNKANYFTNHNPLSHHHKVQGDYLYLCNVLLLASALQGCVDVLGLKLKRNQESRTANSIQSKIQADNPLQAVKHVQDRPVLVFEHAPLGIFGNATMAHGVLLH
eukprot:2709094-Ditylum_brightwellii.AAC.1